MWHKAIWKGHPMRLELTRVGLLVELANHYTTRGALCYFFWMIFFSHLTKNLLKGRAVSQSAIIYISFWLGQSGFLLMRVSVTFLIRPSAPKITGTVEVLWCHVFSISISRYLFYLFYILWLICYLSVLTMRSHFFLQLSLRTWYLVYYTLFFYQFG